MRNYLGFSKNTSWNFFHGGDTATPALNRLRSIYPHPLRIPALTLRFLFTSFYSTLSSFFILYSLFFHSCSNIFFSHTKFKTYGCLHILNQVLWAPSSRILLRGNPQRREKILQETTTTLSCLHCEAFRKICFRASYILFIDSHLPLLPQRILLECLYISTYTESSIDSGIIYHFLLINFWITFSKFITFYLVLFFQWKIS